MATGYRLLTEIETPSAIVDLERLEDNISRLQTYLDKHHIVSWPHIKTHKIPEIACMQIASGAAGITCQKLSEAEVMADAGIEAIFLPYNILGQLKLNRLEALARRINVRVTADSQVTVAGLSSVMSRSGLELTVLVEFDTGLGRCGVQEPSEAASLAETITDSTGLRFGGLMTHPVNANTDAFVAATRSLLLSKGIGIECVSAGGTPTLWSAHKHREITEYRTGTYVYGDRKTIQSGVLPLEKCAFFILATVVSNPVPERCVLDAGSKTLSSDLLGMEGYGLILEYPKAKIYDLSEEHANVDLSGCETRPEIGERVTIVPNHCCVTNNLFDTVIGVRNGEIEVTWPVAARGKVT